MSIQTRLVIFKTKIQLVFCKIKNIYTSEFIVEIGKIFFGYLCIKTSPATKYNAMKW